MLILSNNPLVAESHSDCCAFVQGLPTDVLYKALDYIAAGEYSLFAHPIAGNERLLRNPFRTVVLESAETKNGMTAEQQLAYLNRALNKMEAIDYSEIPPNTHIDYQTVDYELFLCTLRSMPR